MSKKYLTLMILITIAVILNSSALGILVSQSFAQEPTDSATFDNKYPNILNSTTPSPSPSATSTPAPVPYSISIPSPYLSPNNDELAITNVQVNASSGSFLVSVINNGSSQLAITTVFVNDCPIKLEKEITMPANSNKILLLTLIKGITVGSTYQIRLVSSEGCSSMYYIIVA